MPGATRGETAVHAPLPLFEGFGRQGFPEALAVVLRRGVFDVRSGDAPDFDGLDVLGGERRPLGKHETPPRSEKIACQHHTRFERSGAENTHGTASFRDDCSFGVLYRNRAFRARRKAGSDP